MGKTSTSHLNKDTIDHIIENDQSHQDDDSLLLQLINMYTTKTRDRVIEIGRQVADKNYKVAAQEAHAVRNNALNLGAMEVARICQEMEDAVVENYSVNFEELFAQLVEEYEDSTSELLQIQSNYIH